MKAHRAMALTLVLSVAAFACCAGIATADELDVIDVLVNASEENRALCGIPDDMTAMAVLLIGRTDGAADAITGASARNALADVVTFVSEK